MDGKVITSIGIYRTRENLKGPMMRTDKCDGVLRKPTGGSKHLLLEGGSEVKKSLKGRNDLV